MGRVEQGVKGSNRSRLMRLCTLAPLCIALVASPASAHDPPEIARLFWKNGGPQLVMLTNRGLIFGSTEERQFRLMCNEAIGVTTSERPDLVLLDDGGLIVATAGGVKKSQDEGCSWQALAPFAQTLSPALTQHPTQHATLYLATFEKGKGGIQVSHDGGANWSSLLSVADNDFIQELRVAPSDPSILYASGEVFDNTGKFTHYVARSADAGMTFERSVVAVLETESDLELLSVSPIDPQFLVAKTIARNPQADSERLMLSHDGGRTFSPVFDAERIYDASFNAAGETLWVGTMLALWRSADRGQSFEKIAGQQVILSCVTERDGVLWACGYFGNGADGLAASTDGGQAFQTRMDFADVSEPVACAPSSPTSAMCATPWVDWQREILPSVPVAGSSAGAGAAGGAGGVNASATAGAGDMPSPRPLADSGMGVPRARPSTGGCTVSIRGSRDATWLLAALLGVAWLLNRARRCPRTHAAPVRSSPRAARVRARRS